MRDFVYSAAAALETAGVPSEFRDEALKRLAKSELTTSRQQLIFNYKLAFESMRFREGSICSFVGPYRRPIASAVMGLPICIAAS